MPATAPWGKIQFDSPMTLVNFILAQLLMERTQWLDDPYYVIFPPQRFLPKFQNYEALVFKLRVI